MSKESTTYIVKAAIEPNSPSMSDESLMSKTFSYLADKLLLFSLLYGNGVFEHYLFELSLQEQTETESLSMAQI